MKPSPLVHYPWLGRTLGLCQFGFAFLTALAPFAADNNPPKIDNDHARILVVSSPPDVKTPLHKHDMNRVMIYLDAGKMTLTDPNGKVETLNFKAGEALWSPAGGLHTSLNVSGHAVRIVEVELKSKAGVASTLKQPALDPIKVDPKRYKVEFENDQVRVFRVRYEPHGKGVMHEHTLNRVVTFLTDGNMKVTTPDGESKILKTAAGDVIEGGAAKHIEENLGDRPFEVVVVEFKQ
jgi:quercetin dioxygenase-like cupin family protein